MGGRLILDQAHKVDLVGYTNWGGVLPTSPFDAESSFKVFRLMVNVHIRGEMTVTNHTALYRFTFPRTTSTENSPLILLDLTDLSDSRSFGNVSADAQTGRILASGVFLPSFGIGTQTVYACAAFSGAQVRDTGIFVNNRGGNITKSYSIV